MPSIISEHEQHVDSGGKPIVNGTIHIGARNTDPTLLANKITIYSDRALTTPLANPQATDAEGRSVNKIWVPGRYSIVVQDSESAQQYSELDAGENPETGISALTNVQGTNAITADGDPTIDTLLDQQAYIFRAAGGNTGAVTLQIDLTAAKSVLKQHDVALVSGDIEANQTIYVVYNELDDTFEMINQPIVLSATDFNVSNNLTVGNDIDALTGTIDTLTTDSITAETTNGNLPVTGNGTGAASVNGIYPDKINIGDWNMDTTGSVNVAHGKDVTKIIGVSAMIRDDTDAFHEPITAGKNLASEPDAHISTIGTTNITLSRKVGGAYDSTSYDSTTYNRGWIIIQYID